MVKCNGCLVLVKATFYLLTLAAAVAGSVSIEDVQLHRHLNQANERNTVKVARRGAETLKRLIEKAKNGTVLEMESNQTIELNEEIVVMTSITLKGDGKGKKPIIKCMAPEARFQIRASNVTMEAFTIRDCKSTAIQMVLYGEDGPKCGSRSTTPTLNVKITNVDFIGNKFLRIPSGCMPGGAGLGVGTGFRVTIMDCLFESNTGIRGGGMHMQAGAAVTVTNSVFRENEAIQKGMHDAAMGAAILADGRWSKGKKSSLSVQNCRFIQNICTGNPDILVTIQLGEESNYVTHHNHTIADPYLVGGAIYVLNFEKIVVNNSTFFENSALALGGAMVIRDTVSILLSNSTFKGNKAVIPDSPEGQSSPKSSVGGAVYITSYFETRIKLKIKHCDFKGNLADHGGALHVATLSGKETGKLMISSSKFVGNRARLSGGAVILRNSNMDLEMKNILVAENEAGLNGGGIYVTTLARLTVLYGNFEHNIAYNGGGLYCFGSGVVHLHGLVKFHANKAVMNGGAMGFRQTMMKRDIKVGMVELLNNVARRGGAIYTESVSMINLGPSEEFTPNGDLLPVTELPFAVVKGNKAEAGGALYIRSTSPDSNIVAIENCAFIDNHAVQNITPELEAVEQKLYALGVRKQGRKLLFDDVDITDKLIDPLGNDPCIPGGGGAICLAMNNVPEQTDSNVYIERCHFKKNKAETGGNFATNAGGAIFATHPENIVFGLQPGDVMLDLVSAPMSDINEEKPRFRQLIGPGVRKPSFSNNSVSVKGYGNNFASIAKTLEYANHSATGGYIASQHTSGEDVEPVTLLVKDFFNNSVTAGITDAVLKVEAISPNALGQHVAVSNEGKVTFDALELTAKPGDYSLNFSAPGVKTATVRFSIRPCNVGEVNNTNSKICTKCDAGFVGFQPEFTCERCVANAYCPGGAVMVPNNGFWHSTPYSDQVHKCLVEKACSYPNRRNRLEGFFKDVSALKPSNESIENYYYPLCNTGYRGVLCGSCEDGHGHLGGGKCSSCGDSTAWNVLKVTGVALWNLALMLFTLRSAISSIRKLKDVSFMENESAQKGTQGDDANAHIIIDPEEVDADDVYYYDDDNDDDVINGVDVTPRGTDGAAVITLRDAPMDENLRKRVPGTLRRAIGIRRHTRMTGLVTVDHIIGAENISETLKIAINFLQVTSIALKINVPWTRSIVKMLLAQDLMANFSGSASFTPLDCLLSTNHGMHAIQAIILRIFFPLAIVSFVIFVLFVILTYHAVKTSKPRKLRQYSIIAIIVALFFAYKMVTQDIMRIMSCVEVDFKPETLHQDEHAHSHFVNGEHFANAIGHYWGEDTMHKCYEGQHFTLAMSLGIPGMLLFVIGIPAFIFCFLVYKRYRGRLMEQKFLNTYGFLYQNYTHQYVYWEVVIMVRKALISAIVVFAYPLGTNLQAVLALGILGMALTIQLMASPFKYATLNNLEGASLVVSIITFYFGIMYNDPNTSTTAKWLFSVLLLVLNVGLVCLFVWRIYKSIDMVLTARLKNLGQIVPEGVSNRFKKLVNVYAIMAKDKAMGKVGSATKMQISGQSEENLERPLEERQGEIA